MLRNVPEFHRVVFVLSNGFHPDPTKPPLQTTKEARLDLTRLSIDSIADPDQSFLAYQAATHGELLKCGPQTLEVSTVEFAFHRPVRTAETVSRMGSGRPGGVSLFVGGDLIVRMADPKIFTDVDLDSLSRQCAYFIMEREESPLKPALARLKRNRGIELNCRIFPLKQVDEWLAPFFGLSSTLIRNASRMGDSIQGMVVLPAARRIERERLYPPEKPVILNKRAAKKGGSELIQILAGLETEVRQAAQKAAERLSALADQGMPHTLALVETSAGGGIGSAMTALPGASRFLLEGRLAYGLEAKLELLRQIPHRDRPPSSPDPQGAATGDWARVAAVSSRMAHGLAAGMAIATHADYTLAETGMAGPPDGIHRSGKNGLSHLALITPQGRVSTQVQTNPFLTRGEHRLLFTLKALVWLLDHLPDGARTNLTIPPSSAPPIQ